jgi:hypothetical protein
MSLREFLPRPPPGNGVPPGGGVDLLNVERLRRFGSVQFQLKLGPICGRASARIWIITPLVRLISSSALRTAGFFCSAVRTACSSVKNGAPFSDQPRSLWPSPAARTPIGVAEGDGEPFSGVDNVEGTDTVPTSFGVMVGVTAAVGVGVGVAVEIRTGADVDVGDGEGVGLSLGLGGCPNAIKAIKNAVKANPPANRFFRITVKASKVRCAKVNARIQLIQIIF